MQGRVGSTEFWIVTMPAKELTERLTIPKTIDGWDDLSIEERYQREINYIRVRKQIAPYLATDHDRFFGAFIVSILNPENVEFEPLADLIEKVPKMYKQAGRVFGFLHLAGDEVLVPLDGQHRLAALEFAITGKDQQQRTIKTFEPNVDVASDDCTVLLMKHDPVKSRKIFNKVNRYAKKTTKAENLITADDDVIATIVRDDIADSIIPVRLVHDRSNTLSNRAGEFTTLSTLYEATKVLLEDSHGKIDTQSLPDPALIRVLRDEAVLFWGTVCEKITLFERALRDTGEGGDVKRSEIRNSFVIGKPVTQLALAHAMVRMRAEDELGVRLSLEEVCDRVNRLDWATDNPLWQHVLMNGDRVVAGKTAVRFAAQVIAYLIGEKLTEEELRTLKQRYRAEAGKDLMERHVS